MKLSDIKNCVQNGLDLTLKQGEFLPTDVLKYFNEITKSRFKPTEATIKLIKARMKEGYTLEEFMFAIKGRFKLWYKDPVMDCHLVPSTVFRPCHFEEYVEVGRKMEEQQESQNNMVNALSSVLQ